MVSTIRSQLDLLVSTGKRPAWGFALGDRVEVVGVGVDGLRLGAARLRCRRRVGVASDHGGGQHRGGAGVPERLDQIAVRSRHPSGRAGVGLSPGVDLLDSDLLDDVLETERGEGGDPEPGVDLVRAAVTEVVPVPSCGAIRKQSLSADVVGVQVTLDRRRLGGNGRGRDRLAHSHHRGADAEREVVRDLGIDLVAAHVVGRANLVCHPPPCLRARAGHETVLVQRRGQAHQLGGARREGGLGAHVRRKRVESLEQHRRSRRVALAVDRLDEHLDLDGLVLGQ